MDEDKENELEYALNRAGRGSGKLMREDMSDEEKMELYKLLSRVRVFATMRPSKGINKNKNKNKTSKKKTLTPEEKAQLQETEFFTKIETECRFLHLHPTHQIDIVIPTFAVTSGDTVESWKQTWVALNKASESTRRLANLITYEQGRFLVEVRKVMRHGDIEAQLPQLFTLSMSALRTRMNFFHFINEFPMLLHCTTTVDKIMSYRKAIRDRAKTNVEFRTLLTECDTHTTQVTTNVSVCVPTTPVESEEEGSAVAADDDAADDDAAGVAAEEDMSDDDAEDDDAEEDDGSA